MFATGLQHAHDLPSSHCPRYRCGRGHTDSEDNEKKGDRAHAGDPLQTSRSARMFRLSLQPHEMLGPYEVVDLLGEGGMGAVYRAKDTRLGRFVAIKVLTNVNLSDRERLVRFEQEARATGLLNHPNLLTVYDVGTNASGEPFLVSELLEGETRRGRLERGARR